MNHPRGGVGHDMAIEWRVSSDGGKNWTHTDGTSLSPGEYLLETRVTDHASTTPVELVAKRLCLGLSMSVSDVELRMCEPCDRCLGHALELIELLRPWLV